MAYSVEKFLKLRDSVIINNDDGEVYSEFVNYVAKHDKTIILPMLGKAFRIQLFDKMESQAIIDACFTCYTETGARYVAFGINQLSVSELEDGRYYVKFDAIADEGFIVSGLFCQVDDGSVPNANWQTDWIYKNNQ